MRKLAALAAGAMLLGLPAWAQSPPSGQPVLNQAVQGAVLTKSNSTIQKPTRALYIGDAAACNITVVFNNDGTTTTLLANVQPGSYLPLSVRQLMSTGTSCTSVVGLW